MKGFLKQWSTALISKEKQVHRFYHPKFEFPSVMLSDSADLHYTLDLEHSVIDSDEDEKDIKVTVPFKLTDKEGEVENGSIVLTIITTDDGFLITDMSQELAKEILWRNRRLALNHEDLQQRKKYDSIWREVRTHESVLRKQYDSVVFFTKINNHLLFYVVSGKWVYPYPYDSIQYDSGDYKVGVVNADNKVIVPVEYSKIYNPGGTFPGIIEVERNRLRGLFTIGGEQLVPAEYDGIYPTKAAGALAQLRKGNRYGWVDSKGRISFEENSHPDKTLFQSPLESNAILGWKFVHPGSVSVLVDMAGNAEESAGIIVYPSFVRDFGITRVAHPWVLNDVNMLGMGMTDTEIKFERAESVADKLYGLISFFMESGADARGYQFRQNDLLVLDSNMVKVDHLEKLSTKSDGQDPCGAARIGPSYRIVKTGLYESNDGDGNYRYWEIDENGKIRPLSTARIYAFTKFVQLDESYFKNCRYESLPYESIKWEDETSPNVVITSGISSNELDVMRNEIFAEYGFIFKSPKWKAYFEKLSWYKPRFENVDNQLTEIDKHNIKFILDYQRRFKGQMLKRDSIRVGWAG
jgi:hypothetical protein